MPEEQINEKLRDLLEKARTYIRKSNYGEYAGTKQDLLNSLHYYLNESDESDDHELPEPCGG